MAVIDQEEARLWIALSLIPGLGSQTLCKLLSAFGEPAAICAASISQLKDIVGRDIAEAIAQGGEPERLQTSIDWLKQENNHLVTLSDGHYPQALLEISDPPPILYAKGDLSVLERKAIAMVGSRNATAQGEKNADEFAYALCNSGLCVVSGMALGIDGAAHRGALRANGATIAVVGTGLNIVYPAKHRELAHQIVERGLIISEFPLGTPSRAQNFPRRNRIISGLSLGTLVVEANIQSGSLITAKLAAEQGREVFAIPGSIHSPVSKGCHQLIKQGAKLVDNIQDIVDELDIFTTGSMPNHTSQIASEAHPVLDSMGFDPINMDTLIERSGLTSENLSAILLVLELENKIASLPGGRYQRIA
jgi:DNA processing protein